MLPATRSEIEVENAKIVQTQMKRLERALEARMTRAAEASLAGPAADDEFPDAVGQVDVSASVVLEHYRCLLGKWRCGDGREHVLALPRKRTVPARPRASLPRPAVLGKRSKASKARVVANGAAVKDSVGALGGCFAVLTRRFSGYDSSMKEVSVCVEGTENETSSGAELRKIALVSRKDPKCHIRSRLCTS